MHEIPESCRTNDIIIVNNPDKLSRTFLEPGIERARLPGVCLPYNLDAIVILNKDFRRLVGPAVDNDDYLVIDPDLRQQSVETGRKEIRAIVGRTMIDTRVPVPLNNSPNDIPFLS